MRHRIAIRLHGWSLKIGGPIFAFAVREALIQQIQADAVAAAQQQTRLAEHQRRVATIAQNN